MKSVLDSRQLLAATVLARTGSFTLTGQQLSLTQSAVSHAIKALEEEVECRLFTRTGRGVTVTAAGKQFLLYAEKILQQMETALTLVTPRTVQGRERLRLGICEGARELVLPIVQPLFQREFPGKLVVTEPRDYEQSQELLETGLLDLAIMVRPFDRTGLDFVPLYEDELLFVVSPDHPWARRGRVARDDLSGKSLLVYLGINNTPKVMAEYFRAAGLAPSHRVELADHGSIKELINTNLAIGVLCARKVKQELQDGSLVRVTLGPRPFLRQWGVAFQRQREFAPIEHRFIELCKQAVPGILLSRMQDLPRPGNSRLIWAPGGSVRVDAETREFLSAPETDQS